MLKKQIVTILSASLLSALVVGCGEKSSETDVEMIALEEETESQEDLSYLDMLEDGVFYVRHANNLVEKAVFNDATFDQGQTVTNPDDGRVLWFKEDYESIPTLYEGDSLIMYSETTFNETFNIERFENYGWTIGIAGLTLGDSGRYLISTDTEKHNTYAGGDTDALLLLNNDVLVLDKIGGVDIRFVESENNSNEDFASSSKVRTSEAEYENGSFLTRSGTIIGLEKDKSYEVEIRSGTVLNKYIFTADVAAFGSMEVFTTSDYIFETDRLVNIQLPEGLANGYYLINGVGFFRYVNAPITDEYIQSYIAALDYTNAKSLDEYAEDGYLPRAEMYNGVDFNMESAINEEDGKKLNLKTLNDVTYNATEKEGANENSSENLRGDADKNYETSFEMESGESVTLRISFKIKDGYSITGDGLPDVTAIVTSPSNAGMEFYEDGDELSLTFTAKETGTYTISYYDLDVRIPTVSMSKEKLKSEVEE